MLSRHRRDQHLRAFRQIPIPPEAGRNNNQEIMIVITGAAGFIGSCLVARLNEEKIFNLMLVDNFSSEKKKRNYESKRFLNIIDRNEFLQWWDLQNDSVDF